MSEEAQGGSEVEVNLGDITFDDQGRIVIDDADLAQSLRDAQEVRAVGRVGTLKTKINGSCPSVNNHCS